MSRARNPKIETQPASPRGVDRFLHGLLPLFGRNAAEVEARVTGKRQEAADQARIAELDASPFDSDSEEDIAGIPKLEPLPASVALELSSLPLRSSTHAFEKKIKPLVAPVSPYRDLMNGLDELSGSIATKSTPSEKNLYPHRIVHAALQVNKKIREHLGTEEKFSKLSRKERADYTELVFLTSSVLNDYNKSYQDFDPKHAYNLALIQLEKTAKRVSGHRSIGKIIAGAVFVLLGAIGMALSIGLTFYSVGTLSLPAVGLFSVSSKLLAAGVMTTGIMVAHHGRRKGLSERVTTLVDAVANERKVFRKKI